MTNRITAYLDKPQPTAAQQAMLRELAYLVELGTIARMNGVRRVWSWRWVAGVLMMLGLALAGLVADFYAGR